MKKKNILWLFVVVFLVILLIARPSIIKLDNDPRYKPLIGKMVKTKKGLAVIKIIDDQKKFILAIPGTQDVPPIDKMPKEFPFEYYNQKTYGILPAGSTLQIVHLERVATIEFAFVDVYAKVVGSGSFKDFVLDVKDVTDQTKKPPTFDPEYVEEKSLTP